MWKLDLTITLGNVISLAGTVGAVAAAYLKHRDRLAKIEERIATIETKLEPIWTAFLQGKLHFPGDRR